jgi:signal transduction histidine kinase/DNA-binding response OmpR family regulator
MLNLFTLDIRFENDVVLVRQKARTVAAALKFDLQDQTRIATAVSEIARNAFQYGGGGKIEFALQTTPQKVLLITIRDKGKGIPNLNEIFAGKYVPQTGMGLGLIGAERLMDEFRVESNAGRGTTVVLGKNTPARFESLSARDLDALLGKIEKSSQDPYEEVRSQNKELLSTLEELRTRQEELAQLNRELDETNRGVVALYAELNDKADFLQRASELKSHFLSNMSHEFRTPLNSITALSQILLDRLDGDLTAEQEKQVRYIRRSSQDLTDLVNDLLDLAKVEAGRVTIRPTPFRVDGLFAGLRGMLRPLLMQNSSVNLVFVDPVDIPEIYSDEARISQILRNFISNALKFTERGEVRVSVKLGDAGMIVFSVADTGIGIAPEDQERIFEEWTQVEGRHQKHVKGTGLGLPLSRRFAQLLGGDVSVTSQLGHGATFFATIPMTVATELPVSFAPKVNTEIHPGKHLVLVVEDNPEALFIYDKYFKDTKFQMIPARSLKEARDALRQFRPQAIVLDVLLQGEHSWGLLEELKQTPSTADIPVFVVTVVENRGKALALGADAFCAKPAERSWLLSQLNTFVSGDSLPHVLIIDDDEVSRYLIRSILADQNLRLTESTDGHQGLRQARDSKPDLIILDLRMPDLSGFEVLERLRRDAQTSGIPVIIHTSKVLDPGERQALQHAIAVISKDSKSREYLLGKFADAFRKAGVRFTETAKEGQHV